MCIESVYTYACIQYNSMHCIFPCTYSQTSACISLFKDMYIERVYNGCINIKTQIFDYRIIYIYT